MFIKKNSRRRHVNNLAVGYLPVFRVHFMHSLFIKVISYANLLDHKKYFKVKTTKYKIKAKPLIIRLFCVLGQSINGVEVSFFQNFLLRNVKNLCSLACLENALKWTLIAGLWRMFWHASVNKSWLRQSQCNCMSMTPPSIDNDGALPIPCIQHCHPVPNQSNFIVARSRIHLCLGALAIEWLAKGNPSNLG